MPHIKMKVLDILLCGCNGRMGRAVAQQVAASDKIRIVAGIDIMATQNDSFPVFSSFSDFKGKADVIIDFSNPKGLASLLDYAVATGTPAVVCTTGLDEQQKQSLRDASEKVAIFFSANMSIGINLICELAKKAAALLGTQYDIEIIEKHHNQKLDAPSGTALLIADEISTVFDEPREYVYDRHSVRRKRDTREIGIHAIRGGNIIGEHEVIFAGPNEVIELSHSAASREVFALGAVRAAEFTAGKGAGMYNMSMLIAQTEAK